MQVAKIALRAALRTFSALALIAGLAIQARASCELPSADGSGLTSVEIIFADGIGELVGGGEYGLANGAQPLGELVFAVEYHPATLNVATYQSNAARVIPPANPALLTIGAIAVSGNDVLMSGQLVAGNEAVLITLCGIAGSGDVLQKTGLALVNEVTFETTDSPQDTDGDGRPDVLDNCIDSVNPQQQDTDDDGFGNLCDADLNNDCVINFIDLEIFKARFFSSDPNADLNSDGQVDFADLAIVRSSFFTSPGPSGFPTVCAER